MRAADLFRPIHSRTSGVDGWVSLEVSPLLAHDMASTIGAARAGPDDVVLGGGDVHRLTVLPPRCRAGGDNNAFLGGFRLRPEAGARQNSTRARPHLS
jgi:hypothetical protein